MSEKTIIKYIFPVFAILFVIAGLHHLYEYFVPELRPNYPPMRHIVFLGINLIFAYLMLNRTKYFVPLLLLISIQQLVGHGGNIIQSWSSKSAALYTDWFVVLMVPIIFLTYTYDVFRKNNDA